tara:strand:+ start:705 stop:962 length:258 start_codon:yes stop_codon:yes gene_type:complete
MARNYLIIQSSELDKVEFSPLVNSAPVLETSADTVRKSVDGTKALIKWEGDTTPSFVSNLTSTEGPCTQEQILTILRTEAWTPKY